MPLINFKLKPPEEIGCYLAGILLGESRQKP